MPSKSNNPMASVAAMPLSNGSAAAAAASIAPGGTTTTDMHLEMNQALDAAALAGHAMPQTPAQQVLLSPADRFGLLGLLHLIRTEDPDASMLSLGSDLSKLGLDMNRKE